MNEEHLRTRADTAEAALAECRAEKDEAYAERNRLVAALSSFFPASLERHDGEDWEDDWRWVVFIDTPKGQLSWHIHDSEFDLFGHLPRIQGRKWDGHTTDEKYARLRDAVDTASRMGTIDGLRAALAELDTKMWGSSPPR